MILSNQIQYCIDALILAAIILLLPYFLPAALAAMSLIPGIVISIALIVIRRRLFSRIPTSRFSDQDLQGLLDINLKGKFVLLARDSVYQIYVIGIIFGVGIALTIIGLIYRIKILVHLPLIGALIVMYAQNIILPWPEKRIIKEVLGRRSTGDLTTNTGAPGGKGQSGE